MPEVLITKIRWQRTIFELEGISESVVSLYLERLEDGRRISFSDTFVHENAFRCTMDLMTAEGRRPLSEGTWEIRSVLQVPETSSALIKNVTENAAFSNEVFLNLERQSRFFRYGGDESAYAVWFSFDVNEEGIRRSALHIMFYLRNQQPERNRRGYVYANKGFHILYRIVTMFTRRKGNRILFLKQNADHPSDNMQALYTRMIERGIDRDYEIKCRYRNVFADQRQNIAEWLKDLWAIQQSDYIFIDDYTPVFNVIDPDKHVVLTQLWHAGVGFKSVGYARFGMQGTPHPYVSSHRKYSYALVGNEHLRDIYSEVFGIEREAFLATGLPRLDHFLDGSVMRTSRNELYRRYPQLQDARVILFAPTFRGAGQKDAFYPYEYMDVKALYDLCEKTDSYFIYEMHHFIKERPRIPAEYAGRILDLTDENLNELFYIADVLITDYSSCFYDFLLLERPVILYLPDKTEYIAGHGIQRPIDELAPGEICETFEDLIDTLCSGHYEQVKPKSVTIDRAAEHGMTASDRVIDTILLKKDVPGVRMVIKEPGCE